MKSHHINLIAGRPAILLALTAIVTFGLGLTGCANQNESEKEATEQHDHGGDGHNHDHGDHDAGVPASKPVAASDLIPYPLGTCIVSGDELDAMGEPISYAWKDR